MKLIEIVRLLLLAALPTLATAAEDRPPSRVIHGGLGYSFSTTMPRSGDPGFLAPAPGQERHVLRAQVDGDFFPERELHFTPITGELLKIEGRRRGHGGVTLTRQQCGKDLQLVQQALRDKYPTIELVAHGAQPVDRSQLCEGARRLPGVVGPVGEGRCIQLECTAGTDERATLTITYWNVDIYARAQREEQEWRDEIQKRQGSARGLDPDKL